VDPDLTEDVRIQAIETVFEICVRPYPYTAIETVYESVFGPEKNCVHPDLTEDVWFEKIVYTNLG
jgi:hypothetical protein